MKKCKTCGQPILFGTFCSRFCKEFFVKEIYGEECNEP